jgi:hypothetical protein
MAIFFLNSCAFTDEQKLNYYLNSEDYVIEVNVYGGIVGMWTSEYHLKRNDLGYYIVLDENRENSSSIILSLAQKDSLDLFLKESFKTHDPNKKITASCIGGGDVDYILKSGFTEKHLKPSYRCDTLFLSVVRRLIN